jgi:hypothetical protein
MITYGPKKLMSDIELIYTVNYYANILKLKSQRLFGVFRAAWHWWLDS